MSTEEIKEYIGTQLKALTSIESPTGFTKNATDYLMKQLEAMGYAPQLSNKGNVSVEIGGEGAPLVLAAHVDTLGAMVRSIKDNGRLRPTTIGGHQWSTADGENCMVFTRDGRMYTGVVLNTEPSAHVADEKVETKEENMETELSNLAKSEGLDYAIDVYPHYGSDVEATLHSGYDIRHGLIGAGVYASHNYERSHMDGVENTYKLLKKYITK